MLSISDISKSYGDQTLFSAVTFNMGAGYVAPEVVYK